jgi:hypothetical protein
MELQNKVAKSRKRLFEIRKRLLKFLCEVVVEVLQQNLANIATLR